MGRDVELGPHLRFKKKYLENVLSGKKHVTVRYGVVRPRFGLIFLVCCDEIYGEAVITRVYYTKLGRLGEDVVAAEGLHSKDDLLSELREIYGEVHDDDTVSVIFFTVVRRYEKPVPIAHMRGGRA